MKTAQIILNTVNEPVGIYTPADCVAKTYETIELSTDYASAKCWEHVKRQIAQTKDVKHTTNTPPSWLRSYLILNRKEVAFTSSVLDANNCNKISRFDASNNNGIDYPAVSFSADGKKV